MLTKLPWFLRQTKNSVKQGFVDEMKYPTLLRINPKLF